MMAMNAAGASTRASYSKPKSSKPAATAAKAKRPKAPDAALMAAAAVYQKTRANDAALDALPRVDAGTAEDERREREGLRLCDKRDRALEKAAKIPAETMAGALLKAAMLGDALQHARGLMIGHKDGEWQLAASLAADVRRTAAPASLAAVLQNEDAGPDAELIELCAAWPAATRAANAETENDGPITEAWQALCDRIETLTPRTLAGMIAKARVAKADAIMPDGSERPEGGYAATAAWGLVNALLRLTGEGAA